MTSKHSMAVILAAGMGLRLRPLTAAIPKALVNIGKRTLLDNAIQFARQLAPERLVIVVGSGADRVTAYLNNISTCGCEVVVNDRYRSGSILSMCAALPYLTSSCYLFNVDHIYPLDLARRLELAANQSEISVFCDQGRVLGGDDMKVVLHPDKRHVAAISKHLLQFDCGYIGTTFIPQCCLKQYESALGSVLQKEGDSISVEGVLQQLCASGENVACARMGEINWCEIDTPEDYAHFMRSFVVNG